MTILKPFAVLGISFLSDNVMTNGIKFELKLILTVVIITIAFLLAFPSVFLIISIALIVYILYHFYSFSQYFSWLNQPSSTPPQLLGFWRFLIQNDLSKINSVKKIKQKTKRILDQVETATKAFPDATILVNEKGQIQWSNEAAFSLLKVSEKDRNLDIVKVLSNDEFNDFYTKMPTEEVRIGGFNNSQVTLSFKIIHYKKDQKLIIARDVSQQLQLQKSRRSFVANASHELRTPLTVITGYLEILQSNKDLDDFELMPINKAMEHAQRMNLIIDDLLELSKIEQSKTMQSDKEEINVAELLTTLIHSLEKEIQENKVEVLANFNSELWLKGNKQQVYSLSENLLKNAIIHSHTNSEIKFIWGLNSDQEPEILVQDNGVGIAASDLKHITERFYRVENLEHEKPQGTGLGLSIVKHIVNFHEAKLEIDSKIGKGSKFKVTFPLKRGVLK